MVGLISGKNDAACAGGAIIIALVAKADAIAS